MKVRDYSPEYVVECELSNWNLVMCREIYANSAVAIELVTSELCRFCHRKRRGRDYIPVYILELNPNWKIYLNFFTLTVEFLLYTILDKWVMKQTFFVSAMCWVWFLRLWVKALHVTQSKATIHYNKIRHGLVNHWIRSHGFLRQCILDSQMLLPGNTSFACFYAPPLNSFPSCE